ncbi:MAG: porin [Anaeromyxobacteraceae bacterium]
MNRLIAALAALAIAPFALAQESQPAQPDPAALEGKLTSLEEQYAETKAAVAALQKLKLSGYIQARWAYNETGLPVGSGANAYNTSPETAPGQNGFFIRRGRLKAVYNADLSDYVLQIDVTPNGVAIKEGYATLKLPAGWAVDAGLQLFPFGYEVASRSSSDLDTLERARVTRAFAGGEYDLGVAVRGQIAKLVNVKVGVFNGNGVDSGQTGKDNDQLKDVIGRATVDLGMLTAGVSGWYGKTKNYARPDDKAYDRVRAAIDAQLYLDLLPIGGTALKGEWMWGRTTIGTNNANGGAGGNLPGLTSGAPVPTGNGWYALVTQNVLAHHQVAAKFEQYTPNLTASTEGATNTTVKTQRELQLALHTYVGEGGKVTLAWFHPMNGKAGDKAVDPNADQYILQVQAKF